MCILSSDWQNPESLFLKIKGEFLIVSDSVT
uniref:Uncharacterized protein n=1 Tax=Anguilla anguilla TaxID=7936 RepID=A0A0E9RR30_ANGAN